MTIQAGSLPGDGNLLYTSYNNINERLTMPVSYDINAKNRTKVLNSRAWLSPFHLITVMILLKVVLCVS